ncbi:Dicer-like protein 1 [Smittium mucronatum]|uniref:Dicer-like protein 1 n=1 Tax=Smittium mucronatum TaxID=133383 RepID=A0A1R0GWH8_9FUNG|nr:Dicer-like protein 1 [Smittium mucronatum]
MNSGHDFQTGYVDPRYSENWSPEYYINNDLQDFSDQDCFNDFYQDPEFDHDTNIINGDFLVNFENLSGGIKPRDYQKELFLRSLNKNTIIVLETGSGKTLIASMIIEYFAQKDSPLIDFDSFGASDPLVHHKPLKITLFLCNTTVLIEQQGRFLSETTGVSVKIYKSRGRHGQYNHKEWDDSWRSAQVHVMTSQTLLNCLRHGFVKISDINLIIFDECHHCRKGTPYNQLMREFYDLAPVDERPRVFGMTASTANANESLEYSLNRIQQSMDSDIQTYNLPNSEGLNTGDLLNVTLEYDLELNNSSGWLGDFVFSQIKNYSEIESIKVEVNFIKKELGYYAGLFVMYALTSYWKDVVLKNNPSSSSLPDNFSFNDHSNHSNSKNPVVKNNVKNDAVFREINDAIKLIYLHGNLNNELFIRNDFGIFKNGSLEYNFDHIYQPGVHSWNSSFPYLTSKVNVLLQYLLKYKPLNRHSRHQDPFSAIIFVNRRSVAYALSLIIRSFSEFDFIRCEPFIGSNQYKKKPILQALNLAFSSAKGAASLNQLSTLLRFKSGETNLLVATQVAEEGLDISSCNLVIRFDPALTLVSFVQARGRARHSFSKYVIMVPKNLPKPGSSKPTFKSKSNVSQAVIDKSSHRDKSHYDSLVSMEKKFKNIPTSKNNKNGSSDLVHGKLLNEISNRKSLPKNLSKSEYIAEMAIETSINLDNESLQKLKNIAHEIHLASISDSVSKSFFRVPETSAQLTSNSAKVVINKYVQSLPRDFYAINKIDYKVESLSSKFRCKLTFPSCSTIRTVVGPWSISIKTAKQSSIFYSAIVLYFYGALNDYLMPVDLKTSHLKHSTKRNILGSAYSDLENIIKNKYCTNFFQPFDLSVNSCLKSGRDPVPVSKLKPKIKPFSPLSLLVPPFNSTPSKKRKLSNLNNTPSKLQKISRSGKKSKPDFDVITFENFNPTHWTPLSFNKSKDEVGFDFDKKNIDLYAYVIDLNPFKFKNDTDSLGSLFHNLPHLNSEHVDELPLLAFFVNQIPENMTIPLYSDTRSNIPRYYKFDPLKIKSNCFCDSADYLLSDMSGSKCPNHNSSPDNNKISVSTSQWEDLVIFTSSIFSLLHQAEYRVDPKDASYAFAIPTKDFEDKILSVFKQRRDFDVQKYNYNDVSNLHKFDQFLGFSDKLPKFSSNDICWDQLKQFINGPIRLSSFEVSEWKELFSKHSFVSDINKYSICSPKNILKTTSNNTISEILSDLDSNLTIQPHNPEFISSEAFFGISHNNLNSCNELAVLKSYIPEKASDLRLLDYLYQNSLIFNDMDYSSVTGCNLIKIEKIEFPLNYLNKKINSTSSINDDSESYFEENSLNLFTSNTPREQSLSYNKSLPDPLKDIDLKLKGYKSQINPNINLKELESLELKILNTVSGRLLDLVAIPSMVRILPWSVAQLQLLSVLPSLMHRLHFTLIHFDLSKFLKLPISPSSLSSQPDIANKSSLQNETDINIFDNIISFKDLIALSSKLSKDSIAPLSPKIIDESLSERLVDKTVYENYQDLNRLPSWLFRTALTSQIPNEDVNYQRLEMLGDSVLKLIVTTQLFSGLIPPISHEGILSSYTGLLVSNNFLAKVSRKTGLYYGLNQLNFDAKHIFPPGIGWKRSVFPLPRTISHNSQPWSYVRGCPNRDYKLQNYSDRFITDGCSCPPIIIKTTPPSTHKTTDVTTSKVADLDSIKNISVGMESISPAHLPLQPNNVEKQKVIPTRDLELSEDQFLNLSSSQDKVSNVISLSEIRLFSNLSKLKTEKNLTNQQSSSSFKYDEGISFKRFENKVDYDKFDLIHYLNKYKFDPDLHNNIIDPHFSNSLVDASMTQSSNDAQSVCISAEKLPDSSIINSNDLLNAKPKKGPTISDILGSNSSNLIEINSSNNLNGIISDNLLNVEHKNEPNTSEGLKLLEDLIMLTESNSKSNGKADSFQDVNPADNQQITNPEKEKLNRGPNSNAETILPKPIYAFFGTKKPPEYVKKKGKSPYHKQHFNLVGPARHFSKASLKTQADLVESVLGASYKFSGIESAFKVAKSLGIVKSDWNEWQDMSVSFNAHIKRSQNSDDEKFSDLIDLSFDPSDPIISPQDDISGNLKRINEVESIIGYKFKNSNILIEALTHSSPKTELSSYQRLEFLGDAVISMLITDYYYDQVKVKKSLSQHIMTLVKHVAVSNSVLGLISYLHNFHKYIISDSNLLFNEIKSYSDSIEYNISNWRYRKNSHIASDFNTDTSVKNVFNSLNSNEPNSAQESLGNNAFKVKLRKPSDVIICDSDDETSTINPNLNDFLSYDSSYDDFENGSPQWLDLPPELWKSSEPPKTMGDIHESLIGAVYADSGFSLSSTEKVFDKIFLPFIKKFIGPHQITLNSIIHAQMLIQSKKCHSFKYSTMEIDSAIKDAKINKLIDKKNRKILSSFNILDYNSVNSYKNPFENRNYGSKGSIVEGGVDRDVPPGLIPNMVELKKTNRSPYVTFLIIHNSEIIGFGSGLNSKKSKFRAAENAVSNWDSGSPYSVINVLEECCKCIDNNSSPKSGI